jgi:hypothetical protein
MPVDVKPRQYLAIETVSSGVVNGLLNLAAAYAIFHAHNRIPAVGSGSLLQDSIGETFIVATLSVLIPSLIARSRRRAGTLPVFGDRPAARENNLYVRAIITGVIFTAVLVPCNWLLLPRIFPTGVSFTNVLLFKTLYGAAVGSLATFLAVRKMLAELG